MKKMSIDDIMRRTRMVRFPNKIAYEVYKVNVPKVRETGEKQEAPKINPNSAVKCYF